MKLSEVTPTVAAEYANIDGSDAKELELLQNVILPAAIKRVETYTGQSAKDLDDNADVTVALLALCSFLYDNRSFTIENEKQNEVLASFLDAYAVNLVPTAADTAEVEA